MKDKIACELSIEDQGCIVAALALLAAAHAGQPGGKTFTDAIRLGVRLCNGSEAMFAGFMAKQRRNLVNTSVEIGKEAIRELFANAPKG